MEVLEDVVKSCYIHIPFCNKICSYCDFCKVLYDKRFISKYLDSLEKEVNTLYKGEGGEMSQKHLKFFLSHIFFFFLTIVFYFITLSIFILWRGAYNIHYKEITGEISGCKNY